VAGTFFQLLVLKTHDLLDVHQEEPYGDITITKTVCLSHLDDLLPRY
jgi:chromatin segregation and condensation protein Rec8/ScpA/Scc1 (kleisin family)